MYNVANEATIVEAAGINTLPRDTLVASPELPKRVVGYDVARAIAVMGMVLVNSYYILLSTRREPPWFHELIDFLYGRAAVLFVMLAGVGLALISRKAILSSDAEKLKKVRTMLLKRSMVLYVMGLFFLRWWEADILHFYGIFLTAGALLLTASSRRLWGLILILLVSSALYFVFFESDFLSLESYDFAQSFLYRSLDDLFLSGNYAAFPWLMFLLIGLWIGKHEVLSNPAVQRFIFIGSVAVFIVTETLSRSLLPGLAVRLGLGENELIDMLIMSNPFPTTPLFAISAAATSLMVLITAMAITRHHLFARAIGFLQDSGKLSLTIYVTHVFIFLGIKSLMDSRVSPEIYPAVAVSLTFGYCFFVLFFSHCWCKHYKRGPLEWLLRRLSNSFVSDR